MNKKLTKVNHILIGLLIIIQPFIVMFQATIVRDVQLFGLSIFEGFNIITVFLSMCITICNYPEKKKILKYIPYVLALGTYILLHGYHIYQFNQTVYTSQEPSFLVESYYIVRTFIVPIVLIFNIYYSGMRKEQIIKVLEIFLCVVVTTMVLTNLFKVALQNYTDGTVYSKINLFEWFTFDNEAKYSYYKLTTKGWFLSGNQMAAILFMSFPVVVYRAYKMRDWFHYLLMGIQMLAMFMLGTKVANVGCLLSIMMFVVAWFVFKMLKHKERGIITILVICLFFVGLSPFSPAGYMIRYKLEGKNISSSSGGLMLDKALEVDINNKELDEEQKIYYENLKRDTKIFKQLDANALTDEEKEFALQYMYDYCGYFGISTYIIEHYDDLEHSVFWVRYLQETPNNDYRVLKNMILEDIYNNNNNPLDKYLGMGYTLNYIYTEADYVYQFYNYGLFGVVVLVVPYFVLLLFVVWQGLKNFKAMFTLECAMYFVAPLLALCVAKFSGHVLERSFPLMILGVLIGIVLLHTKDCVEEARRKAI